MSSTVHTFENIHVNVEYSHCQFRVDRPYTRLRDFEELLKFFLLLDLFVSLFMSLLSRSVTYQNPRSSHPLPPLKRPRLTET
jgi:hypothetical protein